MTTRVKKASWKRDGLILIGLFATEPPRELRINAEDLAESVYQSAALHGLQQTIQDSYSGVKDAEGAYFAAGNRIETLLNGEWSGGRDTSGPVIRALAALTKDTETNVRELWEAMEKADQTAIRNRTDVQKEIHRQRMEALEAKDKDAQPLGDLLKGLNG